MSATDIVHRAVMLVLFEVSMSTELNMSSSRSVCVVGASAYTIIVIASLLQIDLTPASKLYSYRIVLAFEGANDVLRETILPVARLDRSHLS